MSNLGNSITNATTILSIFSDISSSKDDLTAFAKGSAEIKRIFESMKPDDAVKAFKKLGVDGGDLVKILDECGVSTDKFSEALQKSGKSGGSFVTKLKTGFDGFAKSIGLSSKALLGWMGGITAAVAVFTILSNVQKKMYENAQQGAETYREQTASLEAYKTEIESLKTSLDSGNLSEQEAYEVRTKLLSIQDSLVSAYGTEAAGLDLLTMSADQATAALERLNEAQAEEYLLSNKTVINNAKKALESVDTYRLGNVWTGIGASDGYGIVKDKIQDIVDQYEHAFLDTGYDAFGNETTTSIVIKADAEDAKEEIIGITSDLKIKRS